MKRLAMMAVTGVMAFVLSGCGEDAPEPPATNADDMTQMQQPMDHNANPAAPAAPTAPAAPPAAPTEEQMAGATAQE